MGDLFMKKGASPRSPRVRAHPLKMMKAQTMKVGMSKKGLSKKKIRSQYLYPPDDMEDDLMSSVVDDPDEIGTYRSVNDGNASIHSNYSGMQRSVGQLMKSMVGEDFSKMQARLTRALEDADMLRSRLRMELQEKQSLEMKVTELTDKLVEAKKGLQETSLALHKVQMATNQLMSKRDQRELQLQSAIDQNHLYEKKIAELETHIHHMTELNDAKSGAHTHTEKLISEQVTQIKHLEEESGLLKGQVSSLRRENMRLADEKADLEYMLETKKKRITLLEEHIKTVEKEEVIPTPAIREPSLNGNMAVSRLNTANGALRQSIQSTTSLDVDIEEIQKKMSELSNMENKLDKVASDKKYLEDRLKQLEENLLSQQSYHSKQLQQQTNFYQQQLNNQQQQIQQLTTQQQLFNTTTSNNIPINGISLPLDQIQQLAGAANGGMNGNNAPIIIRAVSRGSISGSDRPRSQQRTVSGNMEMTSPAFSESPRNQERPKAREPEPQPDRQTEREAERRAEREKERERERERQAEKEREKEREREREKERERQAEREREKERERQAEKERERERQAEKERERERERQAEKEREKERERERQAKPEPAPVSSPPSEFARPRSSNAPPPNSTTVSIPVSLGSASGSRPRGSATTPPVASPPVESSVYPSIGGSTKPANNGEMPVPARSAAEINAEGSGSRQPSRQQQLLSRVSTATGANPEDVRKKLMDERKEMKKAILVWNKKFVEENKREPTKAEREQHVGNHYRRYRQTTRILKELDGGKDSSGGDNGESTKDKGDDL